ncbi:hypothetical protein Tco_1263546 [Tanacetum coccineum]
METIQAFLKEYDHIPPNKKCMALLLVEERFLKIKQAMEEKQNQPGVMQELLLKLMDDLQILKESTRKKETMNRPTIFFDDDDEYTIIYSKPKAITPDLPIEEPDNSLMSSRVFSKIRVMCPILRESDDTFGSDSKSVLPSSDDFSPIFEEKSMTFSNPLFEFNDEYISNDVSPLSDEVLEDIECKDSYDSNLDESALLVTPLSDANKDECFNPGGDNNEIDAFLEMDISTDIKNGYHDSEGDIIYLEIFFIDDTSPNLPPEVFLDHDPRSLKDEPDNDDVMTKDKVFDPGIYEKSFSLAFVKLTFEDRHYFPITFVIRIFLPYLTYSVDSSFLLSSGSEDTIFDPGISTFRFSSLKPVAYENPIVIFIFFCFCPKDKGIRGESS